MSINIPDSVVKLTILVGMIFIAVGGYMERKLTEDYYSKFEKFDEIQDAVTLESYILKLNREKLIRKSKLLAKMYDLENPVTTKDSIITFRQTFSGDKNKVALSDSLSSIWDSYLRKEASLDILKKRKEIELKNIESEEEILDLERDSYSSLLASGSVIFIAGLLAWTVESKSKNIKKQTDKVYKYCQSCGYKFTSIRSYGTEEDKTKNLAFCIECYEEGKLKEPELTREDFINRKKKELKDSDWLSRKILLARFRSLERWDKDNYF